MSQYIVEADGQKTFVVESKRIGVQTEDGSIRHVVGPKDFSPVTWDEVDGKPKLLEVGAKASDAKPGNWKPKFSEVDGSAEGVQKILVDKLKDIPLIKYDATHEQLVDHLNQLLNLLRK
ncbi:hypothetical protein D305_gp56 [Pseudomonas phage UFV-P2]|uniref:Uncharacterized protein n=1 Tax=Pseudomonas phage UFV-P2 TaxID=1235661 RepID=K0IP55_9CAUD|nr:hypothetical protein D305_gp56 [Pseudomonas phage UFV-P2]AFU62935.1 hypothetical protein [Pseudomonas phage UFV-P2]